MSNYSPFFAQDFAARCHDLLRDFYGPAVTRDREVTLLLAITAAGLLLPYERLSMATDQPRLDRQSHEDGARDLQVMLRKSVAESTLFASTKNSWTGGPLASAEGAPDQWPELRTDTALSETATVSDVVRCLRHALAHGNITTRGGQLIERIVFVCGYPSGDSRSRKNPLRYVSVTPADLKLFLELWFGSLSRLRVTRSVLAEALNEADAA